MEVSIHGVDWRENGIQGDSSTIQNETIKPHVAYAVGIELVYEHINITTPSPPPTTRKFSC